MTAPLAPLGARVTIIDHTDEEPVEIDAIVVRVHGDGAIEVLGPDVAGTWTLLPHEVARGDYEIHVTAYWTAAPAPLPDLGGAA